VVKKGILEIPEKIREFINERLNYKKESRLIKFKKQPPSISIPQFSL